MLKIIEKDSMIMFYVLSINNSLVNFNSLESKEEKKKQLARINEWLLKLNKIEKNFNTLEIVQKIAKYIIDNKCNNVYYTCMDYLDEYNSSRVKIILGVKMEVIFNG